MRIKQIIKTGNKKWPVKAVMRGGEVLRIPQQKKFCAFSREHGCSLAAVSIALQMAGITKSPTAVYKWAKENINGYTGSKLTIYGACKTINGMAGEKIATWHPYEAGCAKKIRKALRGNKIVLVECDSPIHTNVLIAKRSGGAWNATNGRVEKTTVSRMVRKMVRGYPAASQQTNWYTGGGKKRDCGYVIVKKA